jgi:integrase
MPVSSVPLAVPVVQTAPVTSSGVIYKGESINADTDFFVYADYYLDEINNSAKTSKTNYKGHLKKLREFGFLNVPIGAVQLSHGRKALEWVAKYGKDAKLATPAKPARNRRPAVPAKDKENGTPASRSTLEGYITTLRMIVEQAVRERLLVENVFKGLEVPKWVAATPEKVVIPPQVWEAFLQKAKENNDMFYVYLTLMMGLGTRPSEARALAWKDINFDTRVVLIRQTIAHGEKGISGLNVTKENRTKKSERVSKRKNDLSNDDVAVLRWYKDKQTAVLGECEYVFMAEGDIVKGENFSDLVNEVQDLLITDGVMTEAGRFVAYDIRHTYITDLLKLGMSPLEVAKLVGNSLETILKHYDHSDCDDAMDKKRRLMERNATLPK